LREVIRESGELQSGGQAYHPELKSHGYQLVTGTPLNIPKTLNPVPKMAINLLGIKLVGHQQE